MEEGLAVILDLNVQIYIEQYTLCFIMPQRKRLIVISICDIWTFFT